MDSRPDGARRRPAGHTRGDEVRARRPRTDESAPERPRPPRGEHSDRAPRVDGTRRRRPADPDRARGTQQRSSGEIHTRAKDSIDSDHREPTERPRRRRPPGQRPAQGRPAPTPNAQAAKPNAQRATGAAAPGNPAPEKPVRRKPRPTGADRPAPKPSARTTTAAAPDALVEPQTPGPPPAPPRGGGVLSGWRGGRAAARGLIAVLSVIVLVCTGYAWSSINNLESDITRLGGLALGGADDGATDILLVGTDSRTDAKGNPLSAQELRWLRSGDDISTNTDTILLIRVPNDGSSATAISIPRDSYVEVPGIGMSKINAAYGTTREGVRRKAVEAGQSEAQAEREGTQAGREALIDTVANLTGVHVDHYAEVGLLGFVLLTNAVGGVDVCLKNPVNEPFSGAHFPAGRQTLNGPQALSFVRQRHDLPRGDLDRITRQQAYMASLTQKILSAGTLTDPTKLNQLQAAVSRSVVIDDDWDVLTFAEQLKDLSGGRVKFATIPIVDDHGWSDDGQQSVVTVDPAKVRAYTSSLLDPSRNTGRPEYTVDVNNAGTVDGLAKNVSGILTAKGYQAGKLLSDPGNERDSVIFAKSADDPGARLLAKDLGGLTVAADPTLGDHELRAVLTNTYSGPGSVSDIGGGSGGDDSGGSAGGGTAMPAPSSAITAGSDGPMCVN
ncbi:LCP family protein [Gordonia polyisoprenivorans]|uniref:LCP family protein n=1 Tax=Gordonia polyisoprenivorans TaxID=84595 RepID=UPI0023010767|nr:LCP family protein [Gordonia polyisoprenivorans]WCB39254.1 LCP family protein [Gordonia polyisoprenivorans]